MSNLEVQYSTFANIDWALYERPSPVLSGQYELMHSANLYQIAFIRRYNYTNIFHSFDIMTSELTRYLSNYTQCTRRQQPMVKINHNNNS